MSVRSESNPFPVSRASQVTGKNSRFEGPSGGQLWVVLGLADLTFPKLIMLGSSAAAGSRGIAVPFKVKTERRGSHCWPEQSFLANSRRSGVNTATGRDVCAWRKRQSNFWSVPLIALINLALGEDIGDLVFGDGVGAY